MKARRLQNIQSAVSHVDFLTLPLATTDAVKLERHRFNDAKKMTHAWLKTVLKKEENELLRLYNNFSTMKKEEKAQADNHAEEARMQRERNERRLTKIYYLSTFTLRQEISRQNNVWRRDFTYLK